MVATRAIDPGTTTGYDARTVLVVAAALGTGAFLSDFVGGTLGAVLLTLTSSGFSWGLTALLMGFRQRAWRAAAVASTATLLLATVVYYAMILGISQRWRGGTLQDGSSADLSSLLSVGRATAFWALASLCAGLVLGTAGWRIRAGGDRQSAVLTGAAFGLLSADGFAVLARAAWTGLLPHPALLLPKLLTVVIPALAAFHLLRRRRAPVTFAVAAVVSVVLGILLWRLVEFARVLVAV